MKAMKIFVGADMRSSHPGLYAQAKTAGVDVAKVLSEGGACMFINRAKTKAKTLSGANVMGYIRFDDPKRGLSVAALNEIPRAFAEDGVIDYPKALLASLQKKLTVKKYRDLEVV